VLSQPFKRFLHSFIFAQEVERNRSASVEGTIIPGEWVRAAIAAHERLNFGDDGLWALGSTWPMAAAI